MAAKYGAIFSRPGNGISHFAHLERFDTPGEILLGADSHTCTAGAMGMLAIGTGGMEVAAAMAGHPFYVQMPKVVKVWLTGQLAPWVAAKDVILELLRRLTVAGSINRVLEYTGPGAETLSVYERATICNMTQELGATSGLFASDAQTRKFLRAQGRESDWRELGPDEDATYDEVVEIDLSQLEPLIAKPHSPDHVVPVSEVAGTPVRQVAFGSSVNSGYMDLIRVAHILRGKHVAPNVSVTLSPGSRQILINLEQAGAMLDMALAGVRGLEVACGPCIGMGFTPPFNGVSVRTFNRNFPGRSGTPNDQVYLCGPEVAAATALKGVITDPRDLQMDPPKVQEPDQYVIYTEGFIYPPEDKSQVEVYTGPNIKPVPLCLSRSNLLCSCRRERCKRVSDRCHFFSHALLFSSTRLSRRLQGTLSAPRTPHSSRRTYPGDAVPGATAHARLHRRAPALRSDRSTRRPRRSRVRDRAWRRSSVPLSVSVLYRRPSPILLASGSQLFRHIFDSPNSGDLTHPSRKLS